MPDLMDLERPATDPADLHLMTDLLGGIGILRHRLDTSFDAHELLLRGLPGQALTHLLDNLQILHWTPALEKALGMSLRTYQRHKDVPAKPLSPEQSGRTWKFAEILARATALLGAQAEAERWLERPAIGLAQHRPIDLLATPAGVALVEDHLERLAYGVYV